MLVLMTIAGFAVPSLAVSTPRALPVMTAVVPLVCNSTPSLSINASTTSGVAPLSVTFTANVTAGCPPFHADWEFGDGAEASGSPVTHIYRSAGTFFVQAEVIDTNGHSDEASATIVVRGGAGTLAVQVQADPATGPAPLSLLLWANVTGGNVSGQFSTSWKFGDGGTGSGSPVAHTYLSAGTYLASATVRDSSGGSGSGNFTVTVSTGGVPPGPNLSLEATPDHGTSPMSVQIDAFSNGAAGPYSLVVCFGDGPTCGTGPIGWTGSVPFSFSHVYATPGNFTVTGTLQNSTGADVAGATVEVVVASASNVMVESSLLPASGASPLIVQFLAAVSGGTAPYTIAWSFGDGAVGSSVPGVPVTHTYTATGTFTPAVTVTDSVGHATTQQLGPVSVSPSTSFAGLPGAYYGVPTGILVGLAIGGAAIGGILVGRRTKRRRQKELRKEGEQLVRGMEQQR
ncbi:MAG TPA: PKD domain-containing protein [Thermoplasmata archaeon]|nr:PKD domain-containing protein [Thermoplasmata archaeon]